MLTEIRVALHHRVALDRCAFSDTVSARGVEVVEAAAEEAAVDRRPVVAERRDREAAAGWASSRPVARKPKGRTA
jgi:hypothetical protein